MFNSNNQKMNEENAKSDLEYESIVLESQEFDLEGLKTMPGYIVRKYVDAIFIG